MKSRFIIGTITMILVSTMLLSSCGLDIKAIRKPPSVTEASETIPTSTTTQVATPTAAPTNKPTPTATPTPTPTEVPLEAYSRHEVFLLQDVSAKDINGDDVLLKAGQVICVCSLERDLSDRRFFRGSAYGNWNGTGESGVLPENELFFDTSTNRFGVVCFSGIPEHELFGDEKTVKSDRKSVVEVDPLTSHNLSETERYVMNIDWDGDGVTDELSIEKIAPYEEVLIRFRSGQDSSSVEMGVTLFEAKGDLSYLNVNTDTLTLAQTKDGNYVLFIGESINTVLFASEPFGSAVFRYDAGRGISVTFVEGVFEYEDNSIYASGWSRLLGGNGIFTVKSEVILLDDLSLESVSETQYYQNSYAGYIKASQDINIEIEGTSGYSKSVLTAGSVIIPEKEELDSKGKGYLYFQLADGRKARVKTEYRLISEETVILIDGKPVSEVLSY